MKRSSTALAVFASAAFAVASFGFAQSGAPAPGQGAAGPKKDAGHSHANLSGPAKERHEAMEQVGDAMKVLGGIAKGQAPFSASVVNAKATTIAEKLEEASKHFPAGSDKGETKAKPEIWSDKAGFDKAMQDAIAAARALQSVKEEAAFRPALGALGQSCKGCHDKYRMPDEH